CDLAEALAARPQASLVLRPHNETTTGVTNGLGDLVRVARSAGRLGAVDGVSSVSSMAIDVDRLAIDVAVSASQKGWMAPPGIAFVTIGERAWGVSGGGRAPRLYFDWPAGGEQRE